jgi:hypothetical protein
MLMKRCFLVSVVGAYLGPTKQGASTSRCSST